MKRKLLLFLMVLSLSFTGCRANREVKEEVRNKHAELYSYIKRIDDKDKSNDPTPEQNTQMLRSCLVDFESVDKVLNNWKPSTVLPESKLEKD